MLIVYDTSNFVDYPIGGQLTSVRNFLKYLVESRADIASNTLLVGVTLFEEEIGKVRSVSIDGCSFSFLPVALAERDQNNTRGSLRLRYMLGLVKHLGVINNTEPIVNYIHTPEAYLPAKLITGADVFVFSHGSFLDMKDNLRFYKGSAIASLFQCYLHFIIRKSKGIFVLDGDTFTRYKEMGARVHLARNSIVTHDEWLERSVDAYAIDVLFVGRLSAVKNIEPIINACESECRIRSLRIAGAGEQFDHLRSLAKKKTEFLGGLNRDQVEDEIRHADVLVMNSIHEGVPMAVLEAMSLSLPVISTDVGGISEVVNFGVGGLSTDGTARSIRKAVLEIADNYRYYSIGAYRQSLGYSYRSVNAEILEVLLGEEG